jgi:PTS system ascorbate-specific IIA component
MIGVLIVAHAPLASALAAAAAHVYSAFPDRACTQVRTLDVGASDPVPATVAVAGALLAEIDLGDGVLVMTDAFGATPGNVAAQLAESGRVSVVAGVNLPMLLRVLCYREARLAEITEKALAGGTQGVMQVAASPVQNQGIKPGPNDHARIHHQQ